MGVFLFSFPLRFGGKLQHSLFALLPQRCSEVLLHGWTFGTRLIDSLQSCMSHDNNFPAPPSSSTKAWYIVRAPWGTNLNTVCLRLSVWIPPKSTTEYTEHYEHPPKRGQLCDLAEPGRKPLLPREQGDFTRWNQKHQMTLWTILHRGIGIKSELKTRAVRSQSQHMCGTKQRGLAVHRVWFWWRGRRCVRSARHCSEDLMTDQTRVNGRAENVFLQSKLVSKHSCSHQFMVWEVPSPIVLKQKHSTFNPTKQHKQTINRSNYDPNGFYLTNAILYYLYSYRITCSSTEIEKRRETKTKRRCGTAFRKIVKNATGFRGFIKLYPFIQNKSACFGGGGGAGALGDFGPQVPSPTCSTIGCNLHHHHHHHQIIYNRIVQDSTRSITIIDKLSSHTTWQNLVHVQRYTLRLHWVCIVHTRTS